MRHRGVFVGLLLLLSLNACTAENESADTTSASDATSASQPGPTSSGLVVDGTLRCTVRFPKNPLVPGERTGAVFTVENVSDRPQAVWIGTNGYAGAMVFADDSGDLQDSGHVHEGIIGGPPAKRTLQPGDRVQIGSEDTAVLWGGPLGIEPRCVDGPLPALRMDVAAPGEPTTPDAAIAQAVATVGAPFAGCMPITNGVWVTGTFVRNGSTDARCGAYVSERDGFDVVALAAVSPPDAPELNLATLPAHIEAVPYLTFSGGSSVRVSWWVFAVTKDAATCAFSAAIAMGPNSYGSSGGGICRAG
jgi:hypothetical protein